MSNSEFDVAIIGGGLAGSTLARQLRLTLPDLRIGVFERRAEGGYKVGESTVEIASNYLTRKLLLNRYLAENHLFKNGLRYFFDNAEGDGNVEDLSEIGVDGYPFFPSFQIDRARFDADLRAMNANDGIDVRTDVAVKNIHIDTEGGPHRFELHGEHGGRSSHEARWLVDASGRSRVLSKALGRKRLEADHPIAAVWGRFRGVADIDQLGTTAWRARVRNVSRHLSTNHFCYPGYWIWVIPLGRDLVSIGVVGEKHIVSSELRKTEAFVEFLRGHRAVSQLLADASPIDVMGYDQIAYGAPRYFSPQRFGFTGESAAFSDPFYSPGSDFIALENDFLTDLIGRDFAGNSPEERLQRTEWYDQFMKFRFDTTMALYRGLYSTLGSYELFRVKYTFDVATYYSTWVHAYMLDLHLDPAWLQEQLRARDATMVALENMAQMFRDLESRMRASGTYHRHNRGQFQLGDQPLRFYRRVGAERSRKEVLRQLQASFNEARQAALQLAFGTEVAEVRSLALYEFMVPRPLLRIDESDRPVSGGGEAVAGTGAAR